jgi:hypothetical protein
MEWCCWGTRNRFDARLDCGEFLVAGLDEGLGVVLFFEGFNLCHRPDRWNVLRVNRNVAKAIEAEGISNVKLQGFGVVHYCAFCGANLRAHYGEDGGLLRDNEYVADLHAKR